MSAEALLQEAHACGVRLKLEGERLVLEADRPPPPDLLDRLRARKPDVVRLVQAGSRCWAWRDWRDYYEERVRTAEQKCGLPRAEAERRGFECCVSKWLWLNAERSEPDICAWCGNMEAGGSSVVLPFGTQSSGHVWLHASCWKPWSAARRVRAVAALADMGITNPGGA